MERLTQHPRSNTPELTVGSHRTTEQPGVPPATRGSVTSRTYQRREFLAMTGKMIVGAGGLTVFVSNQNAMAGAIESCYSGESSHCTIGTGTVNRCSRANPNVCTGSNNCEGTRYNSCIGAGSNTCEGGGINRCVGVAQSNYCAQGVAASNNCTNGGMSNHCTGVAGANTCGTGSDHPCSPAGSNLCDNPASSDQA